MQIRCPVCHKNSSVQDGFAGRLVKCPYCSEAIVAPSAEEVSAAEAAAPQQSWAPPPPAPAPRELAPPELPAFYGPLPPPRPSRPTQMMPPGAPPFPTPPPMPPTPGGRPTQVQPPGSAAAKPTQLAPPGTPPMATAEPPPPMPPRPPAPQRYDVDAMRKGYAEDAREAQRRHYRFDPEMPSASATREKNTWNRESLEASARGRGHGRKEVESLLEAFDKAAKSAERLAEKNDHLGQREAERAAKEEASETLRKQQLQERAQQEEASRRKKQEAESRAGWQRMTGKSSMGDTLFGAERLERDPRGYMMNVASMVMSGPVMDKLRALVGGTISGASAGYQVAGLAGAAVGAAGGAASDAFNLGKSVNPQASNTFDQSWDLLTTRLSHALSLDKLVDQMSIVLQHINDGLGDDGAIEKTRRRTSQFFAYKQDVGWQFGGPLGGPSDLYALGRSAYDWATGSEPTREPEGPSKRARPSFPGVGSAAGGTSSIESYALSMGQSSLGADEMQIEKLLYQMREQVGTLREVADNTAKLRDLIPAWSR